MLRSRAIFTAPVVLAIVIAGVFAIRARDNDNADVNTTRSQGCAPIARADAAATKPATPLSIDVLANDTDADGDPIVFQILKTTGGDATVDDGGTPTDASDDRVLFTPADPAPATATIEYQAVDPAGAVGAATVTVTINPEGTLPPGAHSEAVAQRSDATGDCGEAASTSTTEPGSTVSSSPPFTGSIGVTTIAPGPRRRSGGDRDGRRDRDRDGGRTTRTTRRDSGDDRPSTTRPPNTTQPQPPTTRPPTTTTQPSGPPPTTPPQCGPFPSEGTDEQQDAWKECVRDAS